MLQYVCVYIYMYKCVLEYMCLLMCNICVCIYVHVHTYISTILALQYVNYGEQCGSLFGKANPENVLRRMQCDQCSPADAH